MKFFGEGETFLELLAAGTEGDRVLLTARLGEGERTAWTKTIRTTRGEMAALADWLQNFWEPCPDAHLDHFRCIYSHREHIGEGYYTIADGNNKVLYVYEQLGTSNTARAGELRGLIAR